MIYKNKTCQNCLYKDEAPKPPGVPNLKAPKRYMCRHSPPTIVYAIIQDNNGGPAPLTLGSLFPPVSDDFPACSYYKELDFDIPSQITN